MPVAIAMTFLYACTTDDAPSCHRAYTAQVQSLQQLHIDADRPPPRLPSDDQWVLRCEALALSEPALHCLEPQWAAAQPDACAKALASLDRAALDAVLVEAMLPDTEGDRE